MTLPAESPYVTNDQFRADFPAFKDPEIFQNATLTMYLTTAGNILPSCLWGDLWIMGQELWAAHFITMDRNDERTIISGINAPSGPLTSKSVGQVSANYSEAALETDAGQWNQTPFGRRFIRFARLVGMGGSQLNGSSQLYPGNWFPGSATNPYGPWNSLVID